MESINKNMQLLEAIKISYQGINDFYHKWKRMKIGESEDIFRNVLIEILILYKNLQKVTQLSKFFNDLRFLKQYRQLLDSINQLDYDFKILKIQFQSSPQNFSLDFYQKNKFCLKRNLIGEVYKFYTELNYLQIKARFLYQNWDNQFLKKLYIQGIHIQTIVKIRDQNIRQDTIRLLTDENFQAMKIKRIGDVLLLKNMKKNI